MSYQKQIELCVIHFVALHVIAEIPNFYFESLGSGKKDILKEILEEKHVHMCENCLKVDRKYLDFEEWEEKKDERQERKLQGIECGCHVHEGNEFSYPKTGNYKFGFF